MLCSPKTPSDFSAGATTWRGFGAPQSRGHPMADCRSLPQMCLLGPVPPRTPGRSDAQVPSDAERGASRYGRIPFVYFYQDGATADPAFGLLDIEVAIQRRGPEDF